MKVVFAIARYLLGFVFTLAGLNGFLNFIPATPMPALAGQFVGAMVQSHYAVFVFAVQVLGGVLLLATKYVPFALTLLGPVIVNILLFHLCMAPEGLPIALVVAVLWAMTAYRVRSAFAGLFSTAGI